MKTLITTLCLLGPIPLQAATIHYVGDKTGKADVSIITPNLQNPLHLITPADYDITLDTSALTLRIDALDVFNADASACVLSLAPETINLTTLDETFTPTRVVNLNPNGFFVLFLDEPVISEPVLTQFPDFKPWNFSSITVGLPEPASLLLLAFAGLVLLRKC